MIKLTDVTKYYCSDTSVALGLRKINLEFKAGEFVAITGESGSGKSTLLNVIGGMDTYEEGEMYIGNEPTSHFGSDDWEEYRRNDVSLIYQSYNLIESYTAIQNIENVLLISEKNIGKTSEKERKKLALQYLEKVGLKKQAHQRAARLSSGQKQRLTIARALAKNTRIIIADEPTGNLDSENGKAIVELLHQLSEDRLVIMVTHNYEIAAPYVTRKIRLYEGEVVEDKQVNPPVKEIKDPENLTVHQDIIDEAALPFKQKLKIHIKDLKIASTIVRMNRKAQPRRNMLLFVFTVFVAFAIFAFFGTLYSNLDDSHTKDSSSEAYKNQNDTRIVLKKYDLTSFTMDDIEKVYDISHVDQVDLYDFVNDFNYFSKKDEDYRVTYSMKGEDGLSNKISVELLKYDKYMRSSTCISKDDLKAGELPQKYNEIVIYSDDTSLIGTTMPIYVSTAAWGQKNYAQYECLITGILSKETQQIYFSKELCRTLSVDYSMYSTKAVYTRIKDVKYSNTPENDYVDTTDRDVSAYYVLDEALPENTMVVSTTSVLKTESLTTTDEYTSKIYISSEGIIKVKKLDGIENEINVNVLTTGNDSSEKIIKVSSDLFEKIYGKIESMQMTLYMEHFAYTDRMLNWLSDEGYEGLSVFKTCTTTYNEEKLTQRMSTLLISSGALIGVFVLGIMVLYGMMKLKRGDFLIMKSLGIQQKIVKYMNIIDLVENIIFASIVIFIAMRIIANYNVSTVVTLVHYFEFTHYFIVCMIGVGVALFTAYFYNRYLMKRFRLTAIKSE